MVLIDKVKNLFTSSETKKMMQYAKFVDGLSPIFSQFGENIYASDIVQMCIDVIATECSKLQPKHIRIADDGMQSIPKSTLNRLLKFSPNELMTTKDFIEKIIWTLFLDYNCFIYPKYDLKIDNRGMYYKEYTGLYPLKPTLVTFLQDNNETLFVELTFLNSEKYTLAYSDLIHLRKKFSINSIMGGGANGQPDNAALLKVLETNSTVIEGIGKGIKSSLGIRGILKINTMLDDDKQRDERTRFENTLDSSKSGILPLDLKGDYIPITVNPKLIDKDTMEFLQSKVLNWFGVSLPILSGDFTDEQYQAFYEKTLEPLIISLGQAFSKTLFTPRELDVGNEIEFYPQKLLFTNSKNKINIADILGNRGALTDNQLLDLFGYPPYEGGNKRTQSLNFIDVTLAAQYQMQKSRTINGINQNADEVDGQIGQAVDKIEKVTSEKLNGAQVQSLIQVVTSVKNQIIGKAAAIEIITSAFGISEDQANKILNNAI